MEHGDKPSCRRRVVLGAALLLTALVGCIAGPAFAASAPATSPREHNAVAAAASSRSSSVPRPTYNKRCETTAKSQEAMDRCVASQVSQLDGELAHALSVEATYLGHSGVSTTESKWLSFMRSECNLEKRPYAGGSIQPLVYGECERGLLFIRVSEIRSVVDSLPS